MLETVKNKGNNFRLFVLKDAIHICCPMICAGLWVRQRLDPQDWSQIQHIVAPLKAVSCSLFRFMGLISFYISANSSRSSKILFKKSVTLFLDIFSFPYVFFILVYYYISISARDILLYGNCVGRARVRFCCVNRNEEAFKVCYYSKGCRVFKLISVNFKMFFSGSGILMCYGACSE